MLTGKFTLKELVCGKENQLLWHPEPEPLPDTEDGVFQKKFSNMPFSSEKNAGITQYYSSAPKQ